MSSFNFAPVYLDIVKMYNSVEKWAAPRKAEFNLSFWVMGPKYRCELKSVVLIILPFNGPVVLTLSPLVCERPSVPLGYPSDH